MNKFLILILTLVLFSACKHESLIDKNVLVEKECDSGEIGFVNDILPILQTSCAVSGCHNSQSAASNLILDSYENLMSAGIVEEGNANSSKFYNVLISTGYELMPPASSGYTLTQDQKELIKNWINQGAKNINCTNTVVSCDSTNVSYKDNVVPILLTHCTGCHSGSTASGNVWLDNYSDVKMSVDSGSLLGSIKHDPLYFPMPKDVPQLSVCKITIIENWILDGAINN